MYFTCAIFDEHLNARNDYAFFRVSDILWIPLRPKSRSWRLCCCIHFFLHFFGGFLRSSSPKTPKTTHQQTNKYRTVRVPITTCSASHCHSVRLIFIDSRRWHSFYWQFLSASLSHTLLVLFYFSLNFIKYANKITIRRLSAIYSRSDIVCSPLS